MQRGTPGATHGEVLGLHLVDETTANPLVDRVRRQLRAADATVTLEPDAAEPDEVRDLRRRGEALLKQARYEDAQQVLLEAIALGLDDHDWFCWIAGVNLVNCHRLLGRLDEAEATIASLEAMYAEHPEHPITYMLATQRGALAADRWAADPQPAEAEAALEQARRAYDWQVTHRGAADGLRAYNLIVALLRLDRDAEARGIHQRHADDEAFLRWCRQGDQAEVIAARAAG